MKSLNLINGEIKATKKYIYKLKDAQEGTNEHFKSYALSCKLKELETIKQDLEVLEIFKKNIITIQSSPDDDYGQYQDDMFEMVIDRSFKTEDFHKVKQWLEENKE